MNYNQRLEDMHARGILSKAQVDEMAQAISSISKDNIKVQLERITLPVGALTVIGTCVLLSAFIIISVILGGNTSPEEIQNVSETLNTIGEIGKMNNSTQSLFFITTVIGVPLLVLVIWTMLTYNSLVTKEEAVLISWAQVESNLQRREDLIPNLVSTVKTYAAHEKDVIEGVAEKRTGGLSEIISALEDMEVSDGKLKVLSEKVKANLEDESFMQALSAEQNKIGLQVSKLMGVVENYPDLRSSDQFLALQAQLEGTENRINITRMVFNDSVGGYNAAIRKIPGSFVAGMGHFKRKAYFQADSSAHNDMKVEF